MPAETPALQLYQAEWCPFSHRVRMRLTELGVDVVLRQVAADRGRRMAMADETGGAVGVVDRIKSITGRIDLVHLNSSRDEFDSARDRHANFADGTVSGADEIIAWLDARYDERDDVEHHRAKRRHDWPLWQELHAPGGPLA